MNCHHGGYIIQDGYIYGNNSNGWACLDLKSGERKWQEAAVGKGSLCYADGMLYALNHEGPFYLLEVKPDGFEVVSRFRLPKKGRGPYISHPVICGGRLYVRYDAHLYCYDIRAPKTE